MYRGDFMSPCEINAIVATINNYLYSELSEDKFLGLAVILNELSKMMFAMPVYNDLLNSESKFTPKEKSK